MMGEHYLEEVKKPGALFNPLSARQPSCRVGTETLVPFDVSDITADNGTKLDV